MRLKPDQHIHIVGIGGSGMSAIARVLLQKGYLISGSDRQENDFTRALAQMGATIHIGHDAAHVNGADLVLITSAVPPAHVEVAAAQAASIPVYKRSDLMAEIMAGQVCIAVAGVHGKTTTTSMIAHILLQAGRDPSYIIGGVLRTTGVNAAFGRGPAFVIEADEYDHMFLGLRPQVVVIANVEWDHPDFFPTPDAMTQAFERFAALIPQDGELIVCADDGGARAIGAARTLAGIPVTYYGIDHPLAAWRAVEIDIQPDATRFTVMQGDVRQGEVSLRVPGRHNVLNALAALAAATTQAVPFAEAAAALAIFEGAGRRFDVRGECEGIVIIDDYAHHPTAIKATLAAARARYPGHALWAIWQPHTFSRTQALLDEYARAFAEADHVLVTEIYAAREQPLAGVSGAGAARVIQHVDVRHVSRFETAIDLLEREAHSPAVVIIMSAGDAPQIGSEFLRRLWAKSGGKHDE
ncbi:MAG: UDP-N-acetylmuramate--L-alanine ligase [Anaerolineae bacterium]|nr:UDP-N-acetylmuramate--L-alanine ligase [Anaerolineae bacterium]